jgi:hypothetical protein
MSAARNTAGRAWRRVFARGRTSRRYAIAGASVLALVLLAGVASVLLDAPVRRSMEREVNRRLEGYSVRIGKLDLQLYRLAVDLRDVTIRQESNPEPSMASLPRLHASIEWRALLRGRLVADFLFQKTQLYVNLTQAKTEAKSPTRLKDKGWQEAALAIFPLKINTLRVEDGRVTYIDTDPAHPVELSHLDFEAKDIRNVRSQPHAYPSPVRATAVVFDSGRASIEGHADFLSEPFPGIHLRFALREIPLEQLQPVSHHANLSVRGGTLSAQGETELAPGVRLASISDLAISGLRVDYVRAAAPKQASAGGAAKARAKSPPTSGGVPGKDRLALRVDRLRITDSEFGLEDRTKDPPYRVYIDQAEFRLDGYGRLDSPAPANAVLTGRFQGSGPARATLKMEPDRGKGPDFDLAVRIDNTDMTKMNRLLDAYGNFDVTEGRFSLYSEISVRDGMVHGYVKPLFRDMKVYDPQQDKKKGFFREVYEGLVGVVTKLLENKKRDEVATVAELSGPISKPGSNTLQVIGGLVQNAFFKAILPGLERDIARMPKKTAAIPQPGGSRRAGAPASLAQSSW